MKPSDSSWQEITVTWDSQSCLASLLAECTSVMRNPILDGVAGDQQETRYVSGRAGSVRLDGRQADRRKMLRAPEDVIRVRVIEKGLISDDDFRAVQTIMDLKQAKHWRSQPNLEHRFTYNGFLTCSDCGEQIHTALARRDYYACKGRRTIHSCATKYMARERLERTLDSLFADYLTSESFLQTCAAEMENRFVRSESVVRTQRLTASVAMLREKRGRVVDAFLEGVIGRDERDRRLAGIDRELTETQGLLLRETAPTISVEGLMKAFAVLVEWRLWNREQKRAVLAALVPDIRVANYQVSEIRMISAMTAERPLTYLQVPKISSCDPKGGFC